MKPAVWKTLLISLFCSYLLSILLILATALALYKLGWQPDQTRKAIYGIYALACLFGGILAGKLAGRHRLFLGIVTGAGYYLLLFLAANLCREPGTGILIHQNLILGICLTTSAMGGMIS